ncbi:M20/M25/M40 family metallo-hydrolase [Sphingosinicella sp. CPCC 101087]|uniref:M20/M25/M40 family metallo-hydrolase n=1 Tax=Sphingosinicella sp. CPCC 101087 TaxID=2497754 RepID=UPI00101BC6AD|nr:M20/M25/M40 family metallo-hydrolase [Sphingosinicella sp. CPCC 101087]
MDVEKLKAFVSRSWDAEVMPALLAYMAIPCESPAFDPGWETSGHIQRAVDLMAGWARSRLARVPEARVEVVRLPGRTPVLFIDVPGDARAPVLIYGHLDKQPALDGWAPGRSAWAPVIEGERLYGRGGADDGYALFGAILALLALREQGLAHPPCRILIEACEESGSGDLPHYIDQLEERIGNPGLVVALDAGCGDYERLWSTTSLRGQVAGTLTVEVLAEGVHSGDASGLVASPFRIARTLLSRLEDPGTGEVRLADLQVEIPAERREQARGAGLLLGSMLYRPLPFLDGVRPVADDAAELALNRAWRPQLAITGMDGLPSIADAAAVMHPWLALKVSLRLPPTLDAQAAAEKVKALLEAQPPYGARVEFRAELVSPGWHAPPLAQWLRTSLEAASIGAFGRSCAFMGGGGGIPFLSMLGSLYPATQFVVTGVLGPQSNAHGPNEFLHLPTARRLVSALAHLLHDSQ